MTISCKVETITPLKAKEWMEHNNGNFRILDQNRVKLYEMDMERDMWDLNGETIVFNGDGQLLNGQHRLAAVIKSGAAIKSVVVRGAESSKHTDRGRPRSVGQWIAHRGIKNATVIAASSRMCVAYRKGVWANNSWTVMITPDNDVIGFAEEHHQAMSPAARTCRTGLMSQTTLLAVMFIGSGYSNPLDNETAAWFIHGLSTGEELSETDAVLHLRNRLISQTASDQLTPYMKRIILTIAWNKTVKGEECSTLRIRLTGPAKQKVPNEILTASGQ